MKASRFLIHGFSKHFGLIVLFTLCIVWGSDMTTGKPTAATHLSAIVTPKSATAGQEKGVNITPTPEKHSDVSLASPTGSKPLAESPSSPPKSKDTALAPKLSPKQTLAVTIPSVSHPGKKATSTTGPPLSDQQDTVQSAQGTVGDISKMSTSKKPRQIEKETETTSLPPPDMWDYNYLCNNTFEIDLVDHNPFKVGYIIITVGIVSCVLVIALCLYCCFKR